MKNILKNMSQEEKQAILEQHKGGKTINTEKFSKLLESKLGDVKPLTEQTLKPILPPKPENVEAPKIPTTGGTTTQKTKEIGEYSGDLVGKTANFYLDKENKFFILTGTIKSIVKKSYGVDIDLEFRTDEGKEVGDFFFDCETKEFKFMRGDAPQGYYSNNLANELTKRFCDVSSGGTEVPAADFVQP